MLTILRSLGLVFGLGALVFLAIQPPAWAENSGLKSTEGHAAYEAGRPAEAFELWRPAAEAGDPIAQYGLGLLLEQGAEGVPRDPRQAAVWYSRAAEQGMAAAQTNLGLMYAQGRGVSRTPERAIDYWTAAAESGHPMAQYNLGFAHYRGLGVEESPERAAAWFRRAAQSGLSEAQYAYAQMRRLGYGVEKDEAEALAWYLAAAEQGHPQAAQQARNLEEEGLKPASLFIETQKDSRQDSTRLPAEDRAPEMQAGSDPLPETAALTRPSPAKPETAIPAAPDDELHPAPEIASDPEGGPEAARVEEAYYIWIGSLANEEAARQHWRDLARRFQTALEGLAPRYEAIEAPGRGRFVRVLGGPLDSAREADLRCQAMREAFCRVMALPH